MKNYTNKVSFATSLSKKLLGVIKDKENVLKEENKHITQDSLSSIEYDLKFIRKYLADYIKNNKKILKSNLKPKGKVFLILSFNEPFILSVVPIMNALVAGNELIIKPSGKCSSFFKTIWLDLIKELELPIEIIEKPSDTELKSIISQVECVYFFGSYENAKKLYLTCAELFVEFIPEIETADCGVFKFNKASNNFLSKICKDTLIQSFSHVGQTCQRISGVFVHEDNFERYQKMIQIEFGRLIKNGIEKLIPNNFQINESYKERVLSDIHGSKPFEVIEFNNFLPKIVVKPDILSDFFKNGYFYPVLWLIPFKNSDELCNHLSSRKFYLGLNVLSDDKKFIDHIINGTKFTRYTINTDHVNVRINEGWGGRWPSGTGGYKNWIEHFSVSYNIIFK